MEGYGGIHIAGADLSPHLTTQEASGENVLHTASLLVGRCLLFLLTLVVP